MQAFFRPGSIAVIGASEKPNSLGRLLFENLQNCEKAVKAFPVNLKHDTILGEEAYKYVGDLPQVPDLAMVAVPADAVPKVVKGCGMFGIKHLIIISSGFGETGTHEGKRLEAKVRKYARRYDLKILGPSSIGIISPHEGFNASIVHNKALKGNIAFVSQSGSLCESILDWGKGESLGFSHFISNGNMAGMGWGDLLLYLGDDPHTKAILLYIESINDARRFISAVREVAFNKPVIALKPGKTEFGSQTVERLTGLRSGSHEVYDAAFRRSGILRVNTLGELFFMATAIAKQQAPKGNRLAVVSNASGPAILAADALVEGGGVPATFSDELKLELKKMKSIRQQPIENPLYLSSQTPSEAFEAIVKAVVRDKNNDGILVVISPQSEQSAEVEAQKLISLNKVTNKPIVACVMGGDWAGSAIGLLNQAGVPSLPYPDTAARVFNYWWRFGYNIKGLYETPRLPKLQERSSLKVKVDIPLERERGRGKQYVSEFSTKLILKDYGLPVVETRLAHTEQEAVELAQDIGFPVVLKVHSSQIARKARAGGVMLNLQVKKSVRKAFSQIKANITSRFGEGAFEGVTVQEMYYNPGLEMILGSFHDPQFGPIIRFGNGGRIVEIYRDNALALPPLNTTLAQRLLEQTHIYRSLVASGRFTEFDAVIADLEQLLVQFSLLVVNHPQIKTMQLNPVAVSAEGIKVLDAHIELHGAEVKLEKLAPMAIRPYPARYEGDWSMKDGKRITIRPIKPEDEPLVIDFHHTLSDESVYLRYFHPMSYHSRVQHERLARICFVDYDREIALVAIDQEQGPAGVLLGVGRIVKMRMKNEAEFSMTISDEHQGKGLGSEFMRRLIRVCQDERIKLLTADILPNNTGMRQVCQRFGFSFRMDLEEQVLKAKLDIEAIDTKNAQ